MSTFQTMISLVLLIFVLSVIVQAVQEILKAILGTKATVMGKIVEHYMGNHLPLADVKNALATRGLKIEALENFDTQAFRHLLDGIDFSNAQIQAVVKTAGATDAQLRDNIAGSYDAARAAFSKVYTRWNKWFVVAISLIVVLVLNANIAFLYQQLSVDQIVQQTLVGQAGKVQLSSNNQGGELRQVYDQNRTQIAQALKDYPILVRTSKYPNDWQSSECWTVVGLIFMVALVSLGAPFWNDVLKGLMGLNTTLNSTGK